MSNKITILDRFEYDPNKDFLGEGSFAEVYRARKINKHSDRISRIVALKFYKGGFSEKYDIISEVNRVTSISHPYLLKYIEAEILPKKNAHGREILQQLGVMEYANGVEHLPNGKGDFRTFWKTLNLNRESDLNQLKEILSYILKGLDGLHEENIVHRDLKPTNILMHLNERNKKWTPKIGDFGISKILGLGNDPSDTDSPSTVEYAAPEQIYPKNFGINGGLSYNTDLWSFGIMVYEIFTGKLVCGGRRNGLTAEVIRDNIYNFEPKQLDFTNIPQPFIDIIKSCLVKNAAERVKTANDVLAILNKKAVNEETEPDIPPPVPEPIIDIPAPKPKPTFNWKNWILPVLFLFLLVLSLVKFGEKKDNDSNPYVSKVQAKEDAIIQVKPSSGIVSFEDTPSGFYAMVGVFSVEKNSLKLKKKIEKQFSKSDKVYVIQNGSRYRVGVYLGDISEMQAEDRLVDIQQTIYKDAWLVKADNNNTLESSELQEDSRIQNSYINDRLIEKQKAELQEEIKQAWNKAKTEDTAQSYDAFLSKYSNKSDNPYYDEAQKLKKERAKPPLTKEEKLRQEVLASIEWVKISGDTFLMGSPKTEAGRRYNEFQHSVMLSGFQMSATEVTFDQYDKFCEATGRKKPGDEGWGRGKRPVVNVSWYDATAFCEWLVVRLPSEAQWEYACRARTTTPFNTGDCLSTDEANFDGNYAYEECEKGEYRDRTVSVKSFPPNAFGLYDMHGNVWEWVADCYESDYYYKSLGDKNPCNSCNKDSKCINGVRVLCGGSWFNAPGNCRSSNRRRSNPDITDFNTGFRFLKNF